MVMVMSGITRSLVFALRFEVVSHRAEVFRGDGSHRDSPCLVLVQLELVFPAVFVPSVGLELDRAADGDFAHAVSPVCLEQLHFITKLLESKQKS
jgi:hypothetical protein